MAAVYNNEQAQKLGMPALGSTDQAPDLLLAAKPGFLFDNEADGPLVQEIDPARGTHGYLNTDVDMQALFIASGAHVRKGVDLGVISNLRVAPTIAAILGLSLPEAKQTPLSDALQ